MLKRFCAAAAWGAHTQSQTLGHVAGARGLHRFIATVTGRRKTALCCPMWLPAGASQGGRPASRRYATRFTNCTNCGPLQHHRGAPYDRPNTMRRFTYCLRVGRITVALPTAGFTQPNAFTSVGRNWRGLSVRRDDPSTGVVSSGTLGRPPAQDSAYCDRRRDAALRRGKRVGRGADCRGQGAGRLHLMAGADMGGSPAA